MLRGQQDVYGADADMIKARAIRQAKESIIQFEDTQEFEHACGLKYCAQVSGNKLHGMGVCENLAVSKPGVTNNFMLACYVGKFQNGKMHGEGGVVTFMDGDTFTGTMHKDRPRKGVLTKADGQKFEVEYAEKGPTCLTGDKPEPKKASMVPIHKKRPRAESPEASIPSVSPQQQSTPQGYAGSNNATPSTVKAMKLSSGPVNDDQRAHIASGSKVDSGGSGAGQCREGGSGSSTNTKSLRDMNVEEVAGWVRQVLAKEDSPSVSPCLEKVVHSFRDNEVTGVDVLKLTTEDMREELGISALSVRKALTTAIRVHAKGPA